MLLSPRLLAVLAAPVAALAVTSVATAGLLGGMRDQKVYPTVLDTDNASYVDVAVRWAPHLLRRAGSSSTMRITLTGTGRRGAPLKFTKRTIQHGTKSVQVVRLTVPKGKRGAYRNARHVVVSTAHHASARTNGLPPSAVVAVSNATVAGTPGRTQFSARVVQDCDVATLGPNSAAPGCDFTGADLAGANLSNANLANTNLYNANLAGANLSNANVTGASMVGTVLAGTNFGPTAQAAFAMPQAANPGQGSNAVCRQTGGGPMCDAIYSAKSSIGAVYYQFAGPNVTRWLQDALRRGVNVFVIENSTLTTPGSTAPYLCQSVSATDPTCAWAPNADPIYALEAQLKSVVGPGTGQVRVQFSSQNFNITHQKTIVVDVLDSAGNALNPGQIAAAGGSAVVSSGNLMAYPNFWGQRTAYANGKSTVINADYLTNPAAGCAFAPDKACDLEWTPRDFAMKVTDPEILARVAGVYASDLSCAPATATNVQRTSNGQFYPGFVPDPAGSDPVSAKWPETWSNGSIYTAANTSLPQGQQVGAFPTAGLYPFGYFAYGDSTAKPPTPTYQPDLNTGNVRSRQIALIRAASKTLVVYNEELKDSVGVYKSNATTQAVDATQPYIVNALIGAARRGVNVQIVMANEFYKGKPDRSAAGWQPQFDALRAAVNYTGYPKAVTPTITLIDSESPNELYIHAKAIVADGIDGWFGSINASTPSMNMNRELGLGVTTRSGGSTPYIPAVYSPAMVSAITTAAKTDISNGLPWPPPGTPTSGSRTSLTSSSEPSSAQLPCINTSANPTSGLPPRDASNPQSPPQAPAAP